MSSAPEAHGHDAHDAFTGEPVQELAADEPRTPGWLPLLGIGLFTGAAVVFLAGHGNAADVAGPAKPEPEAPAVAPPAPPPAAAPARPAASGRPQLTPEQVKGLQKRAEEMKAKGLGPGLPRLPPAK
jgi:hypothetical protein